MSKVVFVASQATSPQANAYDAMAILWDEGDKIVAEALEDECWTYEMFDLGDRVRTPGIWIWEGILDHRGADPEAYAPHWTGAWRRPTPYELHEISEGRWPEEREG